MYQIKICLVALVVWFSYSQACKTCSSDCSTGDCITYDISQQTSCQEVTGEAATYQCKWWGKGLSSTTDYELLGGKIVAYKIQWFNGSWSSWFVPGVNDADCKYNLPSAACSGSSICPNSLRKMWSYFYDHVHTYIICK